jgi:hypothetical protein
MAAQYSKAAQTASGGSPSPNGLPALGSRLRPDRRDECNHRASSVQGSPRKSKEKCLFFLGFLLPNRDFSKRYGEKNKKITRALDSPLGLRRDASNPFCTAPEVRGGSIQRVQTDSTDFSFTQ